MDRKDIGIIVNVAGSILINLGNNLQSSGHRGNRKRSWTDEGLGLADRSDNEEDSGEDVELARPRTPGRRQEEIFLPAEVNATQAGSWKATTPRGSKTPDTWVPDTSSEIESSRQLIASLLDCSGGSDDDDEHDADSDDKSRALRRRRLLRKAAPVSMNGDASPGGKPPPCTEFVQWALKKLRRVCDVWLIGTCLFVCGTAAVFVSYSFAPQSLLAPLGSTQFVSNVVFARFIHNAPVTKRMLISTSIIMCGIALVVKFSPSPNPDVAELGVATLQELYTYGAYQVFRKLTIGTVLKKKLTLRIYSAFRRCTLLCWLRLLAASTFLTGPIAKRTGCRGRFTGTPWFGPWRMRCCRQLSAHSPRFKPSACRVCSCLPMRGKPSGKGSRTWRLPDSCLAPRSGSTA